ncbi:MFS transporter [Bacillus salipaludis]|uniref:MFS transporter n=1 Tax=Bacillus salipaludis TaxID=2547811 RepID=A0ABW8RLD6_9BACI
MDKKMLRTIMASMIGTVIEWYDYALYGTAAALIFSKLFFPELDGAVGTVLAFATFATGFVVRPIGGIIFGVLGDRIGRKYVLLFTIILMGTATTLMGVLPTYNQIGYWAPLLLVFLRILQGLGSGSEYAGAVINVVESAPIKRRGLLGALPACGVAVGLLLSSGAFALVQLLPNEAFMSWGWRIPFLISFLFIIIGIILRSKLDETPVFEEVKQQKKRVKNPVKTAFRSHPKEVIIAWMISITENSLGYLFQTFLVAYVAQQLKMPASLTLISLMSLSLVQLISLPLFGALSDKVGRRPLIIGGCITSALFAFPLFWLLNTKNSFLIVLSIVLATSIFKSAISAAQGTWFCELFSSNLRYTSFAVGREFPTIIGGLMPTIASAVLIWSGGQTWGISLIIVAFSLIALVGALIGPENSKLDLNDIKPRGFNQNSTMQELKSRVSQ